MKRNNTFYIIIFLVLAIVLYNSFTKKNIIEGHGGGGGGRGGGFGRGGGWGGRGGRALGALGLGGYGLYRGYGGGDGLGYDYYDNNLYYPYAYPSIVYDDYGNQILVSSYSYF
jgi:hypothetical protein